MAITPTSTKSKAYQALGIDEIANDIETVFTAVSELQDNPTPASDYTETIVNISSAQILAMGSTPIELLPAPSVGTYYDIEKILIEYIYNSIVYTFSAGNNCALVFGDVYRQIVLGKSNVNEVIRISDMQLYQQLSGTDIIHYNNYSGTDGLYLSTFLGGNPTNGNGTMKAKIYHKTITFGA